MKIDNVTTPEQLLAILEEIAGISREKKPEDYKYVLYVRKSTDDSDKQVRSLNDQIADCREFAEANGIHIAGLVKESESAKQPDIRAGFRSVIDGIKLGKYDGILAWHPDRLARNMKDAGEIIDLLDKGVIKNLKFKSFNYENTSSGKMHLGITFVLSKQYSDHLSESVTRGNRRSVAEGRYVNKPPHGYFKDDNQNLRPDGDNYLIIKKGFQMRLEGKTLKEIADFIVNSGYTRLRKKTGRYAPKINKQMVEKIFKNPVYTGVLWYAQGKPVNLLEFYDFKPMVTVDEFMTINRLTEKGFQKLSNKFNKPLTKKADLMSGMVICNECGEVMTPSITPKKLKNGVRRYFYYRCDEETCPIYGKSVRANVITKYIYDFLKEKPFSSRKAYAHYEKEMRRVAVERVKEHKVLLRSVQTKLAKQEEQFNKRKQFILDTEDSELREMYKADLPTLEENIKKTKQDVERMQQLIKRGESTVMTYAEFLELMEKLPKIMANFKNMSELDFVIKKMYLNFFVEGKNVVKSTLKPPFDGLDIIGVSLGAR